MADKEQIIIDGVNVYGCVQFIQEEEDCCNLGGSCKSWPNCYFKQLARKTQECEKLKSQMDEDYNYYTTELKTLRDIISNKEKRNAALFLTSGRYRKALDEIEDYCDKQISLTGDLPFKTTESDILDIINKVKEKEMNNNKLDNDFSMVFKHGLIAQIRQAGGTFNPEIMDDGGNIHQKKFFAFKFDLKGDIENQILYQIPRMFEIVDQHRCDKLSNEWQDIEFNVAKLENLRDGETFVDLYRGLVFFRRKAND